MVSRRPRFLGGRVRSGGGQEDNHAPSVARLFLFGLLIGVAAGFSAAGFWSRIGLFFTRTESGD